MHAGRRPRDLRRRRSWCRSAGGRAPRDCSPGARGCCLDERGFVVANELPADPRADVWAVGDVVAGTPQLAHVGFAEAIVVIKAILGEPVVPVDYDRVPWAIYCHPEVAFAGLTEAQAAGGRHRGRRRRRTPSAATAGPGSSGTPRDWSRWWPSACPTGPPGGSWASTWPARGSPSTWVRGTWRSTGRRRPHEVAQFIQPHPSLSEAFGETVLALTGRGLHVG